MCDSYENHHWKNLLQQLDTNDVSSEAINSLNTEPLGSYLNVVPQDAMYPTSEFSSSASTKTKISTIEISDNELDSLLTRYGADAKKSTRTAEKNQVPQKRIERQMPRDHHSEFMNLLDDLQHPSSLSSSSNIALPPSAVNESFPTISPNPLPSTPPLETSVSDFGDTHNDSEDTKSRHYSTDSISCGYQFQQVDLWKDSLPQSISDSLKDSFIFHKYDEEPVSESETVQASRSGFLSTLASLPSLLSVTSPVTSSSPSASSSLNAGQSTALIKSNEAIGQLVSSTRGLISRYLSDFNQKLYSSVYISSLVGYYYESTAFLKDKSQLLKDLYVEAVFSDDPEVLHRNNLRNVSKLEHILTRYSLATLSFHDRQLIKETFDERSHTHYSALLTNYYENSSQHDTENLVRNTIPKEKLILETRTIRDILEYEANVKTKTKGDLSSSLEVSSISDGDEDDNDELQYILSRYFTPPTFLELSACYICEKPFGLSCLRHHCRYCGQSVCDTHSRSRRPIFRYGMVTPVRVCYKCRNLIDELHRWDELVWKDSRVAAYLQDELIPYTNPLRDRGIDKAIRVADYSLLVAKNTLSLTYPTKVVLETVEIFRKFGLTGFASLMMRKDFMEGIETLKTLVNMEDVFEMSIHELTACAYYKLAIDRGLRGCRPDLEYEQHQNTEDRYFSRGEEPFSCKDARDADVSEAILYAPLALNTVYLDDPVEMQRLAQLQDLELIYTNVKYVDFIPDLPRFALFGVKRAFLLDPSKSRRGPLKKEIILAIRGTKTIQDLVTDIRSSPVPFPPPQELIDSCLNGGAKYTTRPDDSQPESIPTPNFNNIWLLDSVGSDFYTCKGFLEAALNVLRLVGPSLVRLRNEGYSLKIVGHSLGGAVASLLASMLKKTFGDVHAFCYGCPSIFDRITASGMHDYVTSVVLHDDIVARITPQSIRLLLREMSLFRSQIFHHLEQDFSDVLKRSEKLWAPFYRESIPSVRETSPHSEEEVDRGDSTHFPSLAPVLQSLDGEEYVDLGDESGQSQLVSLFIPGKILHIYFYRGQYRASEVSCNFPSLRRLNIQGNMLDDHRGNNILHSLLECKLASRCYSYPPQWAAFNSSSTCMNCASKFTWHSTFKGEMNEYKERYNCHSCGGLVCGPCSDNFLPIPKFGMIFPKRICDKCVYSSAYI